MRRSLVLAVCVCLLLVSGLLVAAPVAPYGDPAPGLKPRSWACYQTCVLPTDILATDITGDGWTDLAVLCSATGQVHFLDNLANDGPGVFGPINPPDKQPPPRGTFQPPQGTTPRFDGGYQLGPAGAGNVRILYLDVNVPRLGEASPTNADFDVTPIPANTVGLLADDFNHDLTIDLILLLDDAVVFPNPVTVQLSAVPVAAVQGDFNQDAWLDFAVLLSNGSIIVFYNNQYGAGLTFTAGAPIAGLDIATPTAIAAGDFNGDGLLDLVVVGSNPPERGFGLQDGYAQVFLNTLSTAPVGAVGFVPAGDPMRTWGFNPKAVEALDADGNGFDDFAVANWGSATVTVFLTKIVGVQPDKRASDDKHCVPDQKRATISFVLFKYELQCGYFPIALAAADFDYNGKMDLAVALQSSDEELCAQNPSCIEVIFDVACEFHPAGPKGAPAQLPHGEIENVTGENDDCPVPCKDDCGDNAPPEAEIGEEEGESGN